MANDCNILTPLQRDGTSRANRSITALQPSSILIDGRTMADFAQYISELSKLIQFYDEKNAVSGNWQPFFKDDVSFMTAQIAKKQIQTYADTYTPLMRLDKNDIAVHWTEFFTPTFDIITQLDTWFWQSTEGVSIHAALYRLNVSVLAQATTQLVAIAKQAVEKGRPLPSINGVSMSNWIASLSFGTSINYALVQPDKSILQETDSTKMPDDYDSARKKLKTIFDRVYQAIAGIVQTAPQYLADSLQNYPQHKPHIALFWAFLKLLEYPQTDMNALSAKHLDFYYRDVLQLKPKAAIPDSVHAVFELARNFFDYEVEKGTYLKDGKDVSGVDILFKTDKTLVLNNIALDTEGVKNVFVETDKITKEVINIYAAPKADTDDGIATPPTNSQWRAFGNSEMPFATVGFAIASPQLLLKEGARTIGFKMYFKETFDHNLKGFIESELKYNVHTLLSGEKGWIYGKITKVEVADYPTTTTGTRALSSSKNLASNASSLAASPTVFAASAGLSRFTVLQTKGLSASGLLGIKAVGFGSSNTGTTGATESSATTMPVTSRPIEEPPKKIIEAKTTLTFTLSLEVKQSAVVNYTPSVHGGNFATQLPVAQFLFDNEGIEGSTNVNFENIDKITVFDPNKKERIRQTPAPAVTARYFINDLVQLDGSIYKALVDIKTDVAPVSKETTTQWAYIKRSFPYKYFQELGCLVSLDINVDVKGMKNLILENDLGVVNAAKPFMPFGSQPKVGNSFYIGSHEVFSKKLDSLGLKIEWEDLPATDFATHYAPYTDKITNNSYFKVNSQFLNEGEWSLRSSDISLFQANNAAPPSAANSLVVPNNPAKRESFLEPFDTFSPSLLRGGIRLKLKTDFFHGLYPTVLISSITNKTATPKLPYTPLITSFSIDYTSNEFIDFNDDYGTQPEQLFQIHPFGTAEMYPSEKNGSIGNVLLSNTIVPQFLIDNYKTVAQGTFYIGLKNVHAAAPNEDQIVSILFQVAEGSEDPNTTPTPTKQPIKWSYLVNNEWKLFLDSQIISDTTNNFLKSGIIQFNLPAAMNSGNTVLKQGTSWLKAAIESGTEGVCRMVAVHPQAVRSTFENIGNHPNRVATPLDGNAIGRLKERVAEVKKVLQPYPSFGGRATEADAFFYERVSERLRHKQRAVTMWDYEHLVLEAFPEVYKVRCIPHAKPLKTVTDTQLLESEYRAGFVTLIAVPNLRNQNAYNPLRPTLSKNKLSEIQAFLQQIADDFVEIAVHSPVFETVYTAFRVAFRKGYDAGFYKNKLKEDIIQFLSPWIYDAGIELSFGGKIHRSTILNFVEQREYVDFVDNFKLFHQGEEVENAVASTSASVLIPEKASLFVITDADVKECAVSQVALECPPQRYFSFIDR